MAWIWVDDSLLQEELILNGLAKTYMLQNNYKYASKLQLAESEAKSEKIGIWSDEAAEEENLVENDEDVYNNGIISAIILIIFEFIVLAVDNIFRKKNKSKNV